MIIILLILICIPLTLSAHMPADSASYNVETQINERIPVRKNLISRVIDYFDSANKDTLTNRPKFSFIGGPHYSSDTKFGVGLLAAGLYSTNPANHDLEPSNVTLFADVTTGNYYKAGIEGLHLYSNNTRRIAYEASFKSYSTYYWGIGVDDGMAEENKTRYRLLDIDVKAAHLWRVYPNLYLGPDIEFNYTSARNRANTARWREQPLKTYIIEAGGIMQFDTRNNYTFPTHGWLGEVSLGYNHGLADPYTSDFYSVGFNICNYTEVWKSGIIASRVHGQLTFGDTPWTQMPTLGSAGTMRGYYEGQYRDKNEMDFTAELRQHIFKRSGIVVFGGFGMIFPSFRNMKAKQILPSYGIGYRWEFKKNTNVRIDFGFGKKCWSVDFNIGEAF